MLDHIAVTFKENKKCLTDFQVTRSNAMQLTKSPLFTKSASGFA